MTQEEKVALLKEAGVWDVIGFPGCIDRLIALVAAHEREACAKVCDEIAEDADATTKSKFVTDAGRMIHEGMWGGSSNCAAAIRARGELRGEENV